MKRQLPILIRDMTRDEVLVLIGTGTSGRRIVLTEKINVKIKKVFGYINALDFLDGTVGARGLGEVIRSIQAFVGEETGISQEDIINEILKRKL